MISLVLSPWWNSNFQPRSVSGSSILSRVRLRASAHVSRITAGPLPVASSSASTCCLKTGIRARHPRRSAAVYRPLAEAHQNVARAAVLANVDQAFLHNAGQFAADFLGQARCVPVRRQIRRKFRSRDLKRSTVSEIKPSSRSAFTSNDFISCISSRSLRTSSRSSF